MQVCTVFLLKKEINQCLKKIAEYVLKCCPCLLVSGAATLAIILIQMWTVIMSLNCNFSVS